MKKEIEKKQSEELKKMIYDYFLYDDINNENQNEDLKIEDIDLSKLNKISNENKVNVFSLSLDNKEYTFSLDMKRVKDNRKIELLEVKEIKQKLDTKKYQDLILKNPLGIFNDFKKFEDQIKRINKEEYIDLYEESSDFDKRKGNNLDKLMCARIIKRILEKEKINKEEKELLKLFFEELIYIDNEDLAGNICDVPEDEKSKLLNIKNGEDQDHYKISIDEVEMNVKNRREGQQFNLQIEKIGEEDGSFFVETENSLYIHLNAKIEEGYFINKKVYEIEKEITISDSFREDFKNRIDREKQEKEKSDEWIIKNGIAKDYKEFYDLYVPTKDIEKIEELIGEKLNQKYSIYIDGGYYDAYGEERKVYDTNLIIYESKDVFKDQENNKETSKQVSKTKKQK
jgi:hypothetical protein